MEGAIQRQVTAASHPPGTARPSLRWSYDPADDAYTLFAEPVCCVVWRSRRGVWWASVSRRGAWWASVSRRGAETTSRTCATADEAKAWCAAHLAERRVGA